MKTLFALLLFLSWSALAENYSIKTIEIQHRTAAEIAKVLSDLVSDQGSIKVYQNTVIIKDSDSNLQQLLAIAEQLDQKPETVIVTVSLGQDKPMQSYKVNAQGVLIEDGVALGGTSVIETSRENQRSVHHIRMLSGETAHIESGMSVPIVLYDSFIERDAASTGRAEGQANSSSNSFSAQVPNQANTRVNQPSLVLQDEHNPLVANPPLNTEDSEDSLDTSEQRALIESDADEGTVEFELEAKQSQSDYDRAHDYNSRLQGASRGYEQKTLRSGIYVTPTVRKDSVYLDIVTVDERPHDEYQQRPAKNQPSFYYQTMESSMTIPIGQWVLISSNQRETLNSKNTISTRDRRQDKSSVWLRVDQVSSP